MKKLFITILLLSLCFSLPAIDYQHKATIITIPKTYTVDNVTLYGAILTDTSVTFTSDLMGIPPITAHLNMIGANVNIAYTVDNITLTVDYKIIHYRKERWYKEELNSNVLTVSINILIHGGNMK